MDVSKNSGNPKSSILIGFSIINHPFWGTYFWKHPYVESWRQGGRQYLDFQICLNMILHTVIIYRFLCQCVMGQLNLQASTRVLGTSKTDE